MSRVYTQEELDRAFEHVCKTRRSIPRENFTKEVIAEIKAQLTPCPLLPEQGQDLQTDPEFRF